jgi:hypothetical protein
VYERSASVMIQNFSPLCVVYAERILHSRVSERSFSFQSFLPMFPQSPLECLARAACISPGDTISAAVGVMTTLPSGNLGPAEEFLRTAVLACSCGGDFVGVSGIKLTVVGSIVAFLQRFERYF